MAGEGVEDPSGPTVEVDDDRDRSVLGTVKEAPGSVSLETMLTEIDKLRAVRAIGVSPSVFGDVAPSVVADAGSRSIAHSGGEVPA